MPANLPPQYLKVEDEYRKAASVRTKRLEKLRELFRLLPKHKGTEKLQSDLKQKMSQLKDERERGKAGGKKAGLSHHVPREGAGQVMLIGPPNVGEELAAGGSHERAAGDRRRIRSRPGLPQPGIMRWQDVPVQLVDMPPISPEFVEPWVPNVIRSADAALLVADLSSDDVAEASVAVLDRLAAGHTELVGELPYDVEDESIRHLKTVMVGDQARCPGAGDRLEVVREWFGRDFRSWRSRPDRRGTGNAAVGYIPFTGGDPGLYQSPRQAGRSDQAIHASHRQHRAGSGQGNPSRFRAFVEVGSDLGYGRLRRPERQARPRAARRRRSRAARFVSGR